MLVLSTGGCAEADAEPVLRVLPQLVATLDGGADGATHAACALTTTDTACKSAALEVGAPPSSICSSGAAPRAAAALALAPPLF